MALLAIALSGGVDSSVTALLLRKQWPAMVGASHFIWPESRCCSTEVFSRARTVCERLKIPYYQVDLYLEFKELVVGNFVATYLKGKTPNPCIICNQLIRFDLFYHRLEDLLRGKNCRQKVSKANEANPFFLPPVTMCVLSGTMTAYSWQRQRIGLKIKATCSTGYRRTCLSSWYFPWVIIQRMR